MLYNKKEVFNKCLVIIDKKIEKYQNELNMIKDSMEANDVHTDYDDEGSKGELLGDFEKNAKYLSNSRQMKETLSEIDTDKYSETVKFGSILETNNNYYFISAPIGKIEMDDGGNIFAISTEAPIYEFLEGKKKGDKFTFRDEEIEIIDVH